MWDLSVLFLTTVCKSTSPCKNINFFLKQGEASRTCTRVGAHHKERCGETQQAVAPKVCRGQGRREEGERAPSSLLAPGKCLFSISMNIFSLGCGLLEPLHLPPLATLTPACPGSVSSCSQTLMILHQLNHSQKSKTPWVKGWGFLDPIATCLPDPPP